MADRERAAIHDRIAKARLMAWLRQEAQRKFWREFYRRNRRRERDW